MRELSILEAGKLELQWGSEAPSSTGLDNLGHYAMDTSSRAVLGLEKKKRMHQKPLRSRQRGGQKAKTGDFCMWLER